MIVFDLSCGFDHVFEAWFAHSSAYDDQRERGLIACPICGDIQVSKALMAPNVATKGNQAVVAKADLTMAAPDSDAAPKLKALMAEVAKLQAKALETSEWVGRDFASKARAMDAGDTDQKAIHGQATQEEARALLDDGIGVMPLLVPVIPPDQRN
jgi:hypothetical protein